jgi:polyhydroxyalkanoate synthesis regulator phasin
MTMKDRTIFDELKARGEQFFTKMSGELMSNPNFTRAMQAAWWTKEKVDQAVAQALKSMRLPTREEFDRARRRIEALETEVDRLKLTARGAARPAAGASRSGAGTTARATSAAARRPRSPRKGRGGAGGPAED